MTTPTTDDGWIKHDGGPCPVHRDCIMIVEFRDGEVSELTTAKVWSWEHRYGESDIIAYRQTREARP